MIMTNDITKKIEKRQSSNLQILNKLHDYFLEFPDIRFGQALANLNIIEYDKSKLTPEVIDPFFEESVDTLEKVNNTIEKIIK